MYVVGGRLTRRLHTWHRCKAILTRSKVCIAKLRRMYMVYVHVHAGTRLHGICNQENIEHSRLV